MKSNKTAVTKNETKPAAPARMQSALTNLDRIIPAPPRIEPSAAPVGATPKSRAGKTAATEAKRARPAATTVEARIDVGFGNALFIRGHGPGLSWEKGVPLDCRDGSTWLWSASKGNGGIEFKLLLNDQVWSGGDNLKVASGEKIEVMPTF